jgi:tetratricopeptide (TPR) repeat protein
MMNDRLRCTIPLFLAVLCTLSIGESAATPSSRSSLAPTETTKPSAPAGRTGSSGSSSPETAQNKSTPTDKKAAPEDRTEGKENKISETIKEEPASIFDGAVKFIDAVRVFISAIFINWIFIVFIVLYLFQESIRKILDRLAEAMGGGGVTLDVLSGKLQISDRLIEASENHTTLFSQSPFEIKTRPGRDEATTLGEIVPQLTFAVTDYVGQCRFKEDQGVAAEEMIKAGRALNETCRRMHTFQDVKPALVAFCKKLEKTCFLEKHDLMVLLDEHQFVRDGIDRIQPGNGGAEALGSEDLLILHCVGVVYAHKEKWTRARTLLDKIVWKNKEPYYLPAGDAWLSCVYHEHIMSLENQSELDFDSPKFFAVVDEFIDRGQRILEAMKKVDWKTFPHISSPPGYYKRELLKAIGNIASILGEYSKLADQKSKYYDLAEKNLEACTKVIDGDPPSALDHNNLADLYWQRGKYIEAHQELKKALDSSKDPDPTFYSTRAMIFWKERQPWKGMLALDCYGEAEARQAAAHGVHQDVYQYFENQIFWAKLADAVDPMNRDPYLMMVTRKLENARRFLNEPNIKSAFDSDGASKLQVKIDDLLGFAYLQLPGHEIRATEVYDRLSEAGAMNPKEELGWRRRINHAKVLTRLARSQRRTFSSQIAAQSRHHAMTTLADSEKALQSFGLDDGLPVVKRSKHFLLHLDTVITMQDLAEENFCGSELQVAKELLEKETTILTSLRATLNTDADLVQSLGDKLDAVRSKVRLCEAQRCFLHGRIQLGLDPSFSSSDLISKIEGDLNAARGVDPTLDCGIDLVLGEALLGAALAGKGDVSSLYERAVTSFELAMTRDSPELRAESIKALADAYARRNTVMRKVKPKATTSAAP